MSLTETKLEYELCKTPEFGATAIIVAAGSATRMKGIDKQTVCLCGIPVLARTLMAFESSADISNIILVVKPEQVLDAQLMAEKYMIKKLSDIVCGGNNRQASVINGFSRVDEQMEKVLIHDGARPLVDAPTIHSVVAALDSHSAAVCGVKLKDTVKLMDENGCVTETLNRDSLIAVQTPQGVRAADYRKALEILPKDAIFTDDTALMEAAGFKTVTVNGSYKNIKITTPEDLKLAEIFITEECEE